MSHQPSQSEHIDEYIERKAAKINWNKIRDVDRVESEVEISNKFITSVLKDELPGKSPMIIAYKVPTEEELRTWLSDLPNYMEGLFSFNNEDFFLEDYQMNWVRDKSTHRWSGKSRRVGMSLICAAEALAESQLMTVNKDYTFVSYTMEEAINKIQYAKAIYDAMPERFKRKRLRDRRQSIEFIDPIHNITTRLVSHAQRPPRGNGGSILFDEIAHCQFARKLYEAGAACILTGDGKLTVISTPFGEGDLFHEIGTDIKRYPNYSRHYIYWWECSWLCKDVINARKYAPMMTTEERVEIFGNDKLKGLYLAYGDKDSFRQEMEVEFLSEVFRYFARSLVYQCVYPWTATRYVDSAGNVYNFDPSDFPDEQTLSIDMSAYSWLDENDKPQQSEYKLIRKYHNDKDVKFFRCDTLDEFFEAYASGKIGPVLLGGYDVGRKKDTSELSIFEEVRLEGGRTLKIERYCEQLRNMPHHEQKGYLRYIMNTIHSLKLEVDATGMGDSYYDEMDALFPNRVVGAHFDVAWKANTCKLFKQHLEAMSIALAEDRESIDQICSIRRSISQNMLELFNPDSSEKTHHADKFWSKAMAVNLGTPPENQDGAMSYDMASSFDHGRLFTSLVSRKTSDDDTGIMSVRPRFFNAIAKDAVMGIPLPMNHSQIGMPMPFMDLSKLKPPGEI